MKRALTGLAVAAGLALLLGAAFAWNEYLRAPPQEDNPLPARLVALDSPEGQALLATSDATADYAALRASYVPQSRKAYCSVASAVTTLNAANITPAPIDERTLFSSQPVDVHPLKVSVIGMSLKDLGAVLRAHGAQATVVHASDTSIEGFRELVRSNLSRKGDFLLVNYERELLGQAQSGHISPLAAYHAPSDRVLILDVAAHKYPPVWAPLRDTWNAMRAPLNSETSITRGFIVVDGNRRHRGDATTASRFRP